MHVADYPAGLPLTLSTYQGSLCPPPCTISKEFPCLCEPYPRPKWFPRPMACNFTFISKKLSSEMILGQFTCQFTDQSTSLQLKACTWSQSDRWRIHYIYIWRIQIQVTQSPVVPYPSAISIWVIWGRDGEDLQWCSYVAEHAQVTLTTSAIIRIQIKCLWWWDTPQAAIWHCCMVYNEWRMRS